MLRQANAAILVLYGLPPVSYGLRGIPRAGPTYRRTAFLSQIGGCDHQDIGQRFRLRSQQCPRLRGSLYFEYRAQHAQHIVSDLGIGQCQAPHDKR